MSWNPITQKPEDDISIEVEGRNVNDDSDHIVTKVQGNISSVIIDKLKPRQQYMCRVRVNTRSPGEWSDYLYAWTYSDSKYLDSLLSF